MEHGKHLYFFEELSVNQARFGTARADNSSPRLITFLGQLQFILEPWGAPLISLVGWLLTAPFSTSAVGMGLCWWGVTLLIWSARAEKKWLNVLPFPPLTVIALHLFLRWELGGMILLLSKKGTDSYAVWQDHVAQALPINALFTTLFLGFPLLINAGQLRKQAPASPVFSGIEPSNATIKRWALLAATTGFVAIGYGLIGYYSGTLDRGPDYLQWAGRFWRPDTFFSATIRLRDLYFLILPWTIYSLRKRPLFLSLFLGPTFFSLFTNSMLGGRGLLLYPLILSTAGLWLAGIRPRVFRLFLLIVITFSIAFIPLATAFRGTTLDKSDFLGRARTALTLKTFANYDLPSLGREIYASSDPYLFIHPGIELPPGGFRRFENLRYLWLPRIFGENRPEINDGHLIANEIRGTPKANMHEGRYISFESVTTGGDLYWRFRWPGVLVGGTVLGVFYGLACRAWYKYSDLGQNTYTILLALFPATFLQGPPLRSVLETAWNWAYEIPKYGMLLIVLATLIELLIRTTSRQKPQNE